MKIPSLILMAKLNPTFEISSSFHINALYQNSVNVNILSKKWLIFMNLSTTSSGRVNEISVLLSLFGGLDRIGGPS